MYLRKGSKLCFNISREDGFSLSRSWRPLIHPLKEKINVPSNEMEQLPHEATLACLALQKDCFPTVL
jgi:hypothetical protein